MSDLNSSFDVLYGWPNASALSHDFPPAAGVSLPAGTIVKLATLQLRSAVVLKMITDATGGGAHPVLLAADAGKAYVVNTWGAGHDAGDIVEWDGTKFNVIVAAVEAEVPTGTRIVCAGAGTGGSFAATANKVLTYTAKTISLVCVDDKTYVNCIPSDVGLPVVGTGSGDTGTLVSYNNGTKTWIVNPTTPADVFAPADALAVTGGTGAAVVSTATPAGATWAPVTPADGQLIDINGANSIYYMHRFVYSTTTVAWALTSTPGLAEGYSHAYAAKLTSPAASGAKPSAWVVLEGNDQFDGEFTNRVTAIKIPTGCVFKVKCAVAHTLVPGEFVEASAGLLVKCNGTNHALGQVQWSNSTAGAGGLVIVTGV